MRVSILMPLVTAIPSAFAALQQPEFTNTTALPTHFAMLLFPNFQAIDVFGPLDVLNTLSMLYGNKTAMTLTLLSKTMYPVSTTTKGIQGKGNFGEEILPTNTFAEILRKKPSRPTKPAKNHGEMPPQNYDKSNDDGWGSGHARRHKGHGPSAAHTPPMNHTVPVDKDIEVLLVPGGSGTRKNMTEEIAFVKEIYPKLKYIISICTGATILSRAGILDGKRATTNKHAWAWATSTGPNVTWVPSARWVEDGNVFSSSGIAAGIDVTFAWVGKMYGEQVADYLAKSMEYERWTDPHNDPFAKVWDVPGAV